MKGYLIAGDFAQHEVRMAAWLSKDPIMAQNLEKGFHLINLALLEKLLSPRHLVSVTKEEVNSLENTIQLQYLAKVDKTCVLGKRYGDEVYQDYHYTEIVTLLEAEPDCNELLLEWKNKFKVRKTVAKESTFGPLYGMVPSTFATTHGLTQAEAEEVFKIDKETYPLKHAYFAEVKARARRDGFVQSVFGKKRRLDYKHALRQKDGARIGELDRQGVNTIVQGPSSDLSFLCMDRCSKIYKKDNIPAYAIGVIHDSLVSDSHPNIPEEILQIKFEVMESYPLELLGSDHVKFKAEMEWGPSLGEMKGWTP